MDPLSNRVVANYAQQQHQHQQLPNQNTMQSCNLHHYDSLFSARVSNLYSTRDRLQLNDLLYNLIQLKSLLKTNNYPTNTIQQVALLNHSLYLFSKHIQSKQFNSNSSTHPSSNKYQHKLTQNIHPQLSTNPKTTTITYISSQPPLPHTSKQLSTLSTQSENISSNQSQNQPASSSSSTNQIPTIDLSHPSIYHQPTSNTNLSSCLESQTSSHSNQIIKNQDLWTRSSYQNTNYVPPLMAKLFYSTELHSLFSPQLSLHTNESTQTAPQSLRQAANLYNRQLHPTSYHDTNTKNITSQTSFASSLSSNFHQLFNFSISSSSSSSSSNLSGAITPKHDQSKFYSTSVSSADQFVIQYKSNNIKPHSRNNLQNRTYYPGMTHEIELRAPSATWRNDGTFHPDNNTNQNTTNSHNSTHSAYSVSNNYRQHPSYYNQQGIYSNPGTETGVARNFGFQKQTNYPFRKTYKHPYNTNLIMESDNQPLQEEIEHLRYLTSNANANRFPVDGLSPELLSLTKSGLQKHGRFFSNDDNFSVDVIDQNCYNIEDTSIPVYCINTQGKLEELQSSRQQHHKSDSS